MQGAAYAPRGLCYTGWKTVARQICPAVPVHCLHANPTVLHWPTHLTHCGANVRAACHGRCSAEAREQAAEWGQHWTNDGALLHEKGGGQSILHAARQGNPAMPWLPEDCADSISGACRVLLKKELPYL